MCDSCRTAKAIAKEIKRSSSSSSSPPTIPSPRYGFLGYYLLVNCVSVLFYDEEKVKDKLWWSLFGSLESRFLDALLTYSIGLGFLYLLWRWSRSDGFYDKYRKGYRFALGLILALNLFLIYLIIDLFVDSLPLLP